MYKGSYSWMRVSILLEVSLAFLFIGRYVEPLPEGSTTKFEFENMIVGQAVPSNFIPAIEKGFKEAANSWVVYHFFFFFFFTWSFLL